MNSTQNGAPSAGIDVALSECGTGVSQVLAMLYVAVTAPSARAIIIDEPNSFLHPGASKKLLAILRRLDHQYIISTHSSDLIRTLAPEYVHLIEWNGSESAVKTVDANNIDHQRLLLSQLGVQLSDVFGADNVLWVEGLTEQLCVPLLLGHLGLLSPATAVVALIATGDLGSSRPRAALAWELYERLSNGTGLVPPALAFSFDREGRTDTEVDDMVRRSNGKVNFLPRRTYENFLLDPDAIAALLSELLQKPVLSVDISNWIAQQKSEPKYLGRAFSATNSQDDWVASVNAPKILNDLFLEFSESTLEYAKLTHSVAITKWLLANRPNALDELLRYLEKLSN